MRSKVMTVARTRLSKEKPRAELYKCAQCTYASKKLSHLKRHLLTHTRVRPSKAEKDSKWEQKKHKCAFCPYATKNTNHLKRHSRIHTGEKPFRCTWCAYATSDDSHLIIHERIHTGEKPYRCHLCPYSAAQASNLTAHRRRHRLETAPYTCKMCGCIAATTDILKTHMRKHDMTETDGTPPMRRPRKMTCCVGNQTNTERTSAAGQIRKTTELKQWMTTISPEHRPRSDKSTLRKQELPSFLSVTKHYEYGGKEYTAETIQGDMEWTTEELFQQVYKRRKIYKCRCGLMFMSFPLYCIHKSCHSDNVLRCQECGLLASNGIEFMAHGLDHDK